MKARITTRFFVLGILLAATTIGIFAGVATWQSRVLAQTMAMQTLDTASSVRTSMLEQHRRLLAQVSAGVAANPSFVAYITQAMNARTALGAVVDTASIRDLLDERRNELGLDAIALLDPSGKLVASRGDISLKASHLSTNPLVSKVRTTLKPVSGMRVEDRRILLTAMTPLLRGTNVEALLLTERDVDIGLVSEIAKLGHCDTALLVATPAGTQLLASSLDPHASQQLKTALTKLGEHLPQPAIFSIDMGGQPWFARLAPLADSAGKAFSLSLVPPLSHATAMHNISQPLLIGAMVLLAILLLLGVIVWLRLVQPLASLSELSERARHGDYELEFRSGPRGTVARLGGTFNYLLNELRRYRPPVGAPHRRATDRKVPRLVQ